MDRRDAFEQSWATRHRVSVEEIREHRFQTEDGYDLPLLATNYRTWCAAIDSIEVVLPEPYGPDRLVNKRERTARLCAICEFAEALEAAGIKVTE